MIKNCKELVKIALRFVLRCFFYILSEKNCWDSYNFNL